jgi:hypothetical protein
LSRKGLNAIAAEHQQAGTFENQIVVHAAEGEHEIPAAAGGELELPAVAGGE